MAAYRVPSPEYEDDFFNMVFNSVFQPRSAFNDILITRYEFYSILKLPTKLICQ
jgi:hypothetical protein